MSKGIDLITAERERQITKEGWTPEHDAAHQDGSLALAAACYASPVPLRAEMEVRNPQCNCRAVGECFCGTVTKWKDPWPWSEEWDKREKHDRLRRLVIAGALIAAEIDRLLLAGEQEV